MSTNDCDIVVETQSPVQDPIQTTKRSTEFTSENHKLEIANLPPNSKFHIIKQLLEKHFKLKPHKIRVGNRRAYVAFASEQDRNVAVNIINNKEWKGRMLVAKVASPRHDTLVSKFRERNQTTESATVEDGSTPQDEEIDINSQVSPLWKKDYADQLKIKRSNMLQVLNMAKQISQFNKNLVNDSPALYKWTMENSKVCCRFDGVEPSPVLVGYRNKCEFNMGRDGTVGFRLGRYKNGSERVVHPPENCPIVNKIMFDVIRAFQDFVQDTARTNLRGYDHVSHEGNVRQITTRVNQRDECLVIVDIHPQDFSEVELEKETKSICDTLISIKQVVSIFLNLTSKSHLTSNDQTLKLVYGEPCLYEYLAVDRESPLKFRIGPTSFFQVNTKAAEILYRSIIEAADLKSNSMILDVGCGTGTIGLSLAKKVSFVIGIEIVESAVEDAKVNARVNNIDNATFFVGKSEELINECISILKNKLIEQNNEGEIIAIVDPPRTGFNNSFIKSLRASNIKKIIYIACDPKGNTNLLSLCRPTSKAYQGDPFIPTSAKAFDLFPHTKFCELVLVYERLSEQSGASSHEEVIAQS